MGKLLNLFRGRGDEPESATGQAGSEEATRSKYDRPPGLGSTFSRGRTFWLLAGDYGGEDVHCNGYFFLNPEAAAGDAEVDLDWHPPEVFCFNVAGVTFRQDTLQHESFAPMRPLTVRIEADNAAHDRAIAVYDAAGDLHVGYMPWHMAETWHPVLARTNAKNIEAAVLRECRKNSVPRERCALRVVMAFKDTVRLQVADP